MSSDYLVQFKGGRLTDIMKSKYASETMARWEMRNCVGSNKKYYSLPIYAILAQIRLIIFLSLMKSQVILVLTKAKL